MLLALLVVLSGCGGGGSPGAEEGTIDNGGDVTNPVAPQPITLQYPTDFPYTTQLPSEFPVGIIVNGMTPQRAYEFSYTASTDEVMLLIINNVEPGGFVCTDFSLIADAKTCTGTVLGDGVVMNATNTGASSQTFTLDIMDSTEQPSLNEGGPQSPVELEVQAQLPYAGTVASLGDSYYRINNLTIGARYELAIENASDNIDMAAYRDLFVTPMQCDPNYSSGLRCNFVSEGDSVAVHVDGAFAFAGAGFDMALTHLSDAGDFEGVWYQPVEFGISDLPRIGTVDHYNSYYRINELEADRYYTIEHTGKTGSVSLSFFDPLTGEEMGKACNPDLLQSFPAVADEACTFRADGSDLYFIAQGGSDLPDRGRFIMKLTPGPLKEGAAASPVDLVYSGGNLTYAGSVDVGASHYHIGGITIGSEYMVRLSGNESLPVDLDVFDGDSTLTTPVNCAVTNQYGHVTYCITTAQSSDFYLRVTGPTTPPGTSYTLNVTPTPVNETIAGLAATSLPYAGQVGDFNSEYTITGLTPNRLYTVELSGVIGSAGVSAWPDTASIIACSFSTRSDGGCMLDSGANGNIRVRVSSFTGSDNNEPGGYYLLDVEPAPVIGTDYVSADTPLIIPENLLEGVSSQIIVSDATGLQVGNLTVEVVVEHGYTPDVTLTLTSPGGVEIPLAANLSDSAYTNTRFNDYAAVNINDTGVNDLRFKRAFRPTAPLHLLNGLEVNGIWTLNVADDADTNISSAIGGVLQAWGMSFQ
jgi:subtilisin-like proprotein convertase family protein